MVVVVTREDIKGIKNPDFELDFVNGLFICNYTIHTAVGRATALFTAVPEVEKNSLILKIPYKDIALPRLLFLFGDKIKNKIRENWAAIGAQIIDKVVEKTELPHELFESFSTDDAAHIKIRIGAIIQHFVALYPNIPYIPNKIKFDKTFIAIDLKVKESSI